MYIISLVTHMSFESIWMFIYIYIYIMSCEAKERMELERLANFDEWRESKKKKKAEQGAPEHEEACHIICV